MDGRRPARKCRAQNPAYASTRPPPFFGSCRTTTTASRRAVAKMLRVVRRDDMRSHHACDKRAVAWHRELRCRPVAVRRARDARTHRGCVAHTTLRVTRAIRFDRHVACSTSLARRRCDAVQVIEPLIAHSQRASIANCFSRLLSRDTRVFRSVTSQTILENVLIQ